MLDFILVEFFFYSPYYLVLYIIFNLRWLWKFTICGDEYGQEEKEYLTRRSMKVTSTQWEVVY